MARKRKNFTADFETTTDPTDCRVWAYGYMDIYNFDDYSYGNNIDEFMLWCQIVNANVYFHNLRFDGDFIVNWLLKNGFEHSDGGERNTFSTLISKTGQWYMIDICYGYRGKNKIHTALYDSLKKLPFPVKTVANAFNLDIKKGDLDYNKFRPIGHVLDKEEQDYLYNDVAIMAQALKIQFDQGLTKMTNGSDAMSGFKGTISTQTFKRYFPVLSIDLDKEIRRAYRGGFTWVNKRIQNRVLGKGIVFDVNSLYPSVMYNQFLPYGVPEFFKGEYEKDLDYPLYLQHIRCSFEIKENHIPTIQLKKSSVFIGRDTEYLESSDLEIIDLYVTNIDLDIIKDHYNLYDLEYVDGWKFKQVKGLFKEYIDYWTEIKVENTDVYKDGVKVHEGNGALRSLAKLMLNSLYGKFASNPDITGKIPYLKEDGSCAYKLGDDEIKDPLYTAMGVFITSYAREITIRTAQKCFDRICYCDTDSIHLTGTEIPKDIEHLVHESELGLWKHESTFDRAKFIRQKTYCEEFNGFLDVKCAGMPELIKTQDAEKRKLINADRKRRGLPDVNFVTWENFKEGFKSHGKLMPKHVNGGTVLHDGEFTLKGVIKKEITV